MRIVMIAAAALLALIQSSYAITGIGSQTVGDSGPGRHIVMIISTRGNVCTGTAIAPDLVLTAGHCVAPQATYRVSTTAEPKGFPIARIAINPGYNSQHYAAGRVTADLALIKLVAPLGSSVAPVGLSADGHVGSGDPFVIAGFGTVAPRSNEGLGTPRAAALIATGRPGSLQIRLVDPQTRDPRLGLGACTGDSGGPAFRVVSGSYQVIGVVSWSTGPGGTSGCGGLTGLTPLVLHRKWVVDTAQKLGSPLPLK